MTSESFSIFKNKKEDVLKNSSKINSSFIIEKNIKRCNKKILNCICCKDKICKTGNCFCIECMKNYLKYYDIEPGKLINKNNIISIKKKDGNYYCGIKLLNGQICAPKNNICDGCKCLNNNKKIYDNLFSSS